MQDQALCSQQANTTFILLQYRSVYSTVAKETTNCFKAKNDDDSSHHRLSLSLLAHSNKNRNIDDNEGESTKYFDLGSEHSQDQN